MPDVYGDVLEASQLIFYYRGGSVYVDQSYDRRSEFSRIGLNFKPAESGERLREHLLEGTAVECLQLMLVAEVLQPRDELVPGAERDCVRLGLRLMTGGPVQLEADQRQAPRPVGPLSEALQGLQVCLFFCIGQDEAKGNRVQPLAIPYGLDALQAVERLLDPEVG